MIVLKLQNLAVKNGWVYSLFLKDVGDKICKMKMSEPVLFVDSWHQPLNKTSVSTWKLKDNPLIRTYTINSSFLLHYRIWHLFAGTYGYWRYPWSSRYSRITWPWRTTRPYGTRRQSRIQSEFHSSIGPFSTLLDTFEYGVQTILK